MPHTPDEIIRAVAEHYRIHPSALSSSSRKQEHVKPRHVAAYLCYKYTDGTGDAIGRRLGTSRWTVYYAVRKVSRNGLREEAEAIMGRLLAHPSPELRRLRKLVDEIDLLLDRLERGGG